MTQYAAFDDARQVLIVLTESSHAREAAHDLAMRWRAAARTATAIYASGCDTLPDSDERGARYAGLDPATGELAEGPLGALEDVMTHDVVRWRTLDALFARNAHTAWLYGHDDPEIARQLFGRPYDPPAIIMAAYRAGQD